MSIFTIFYIMGFVFILLFVGFYASVKFPQSVSSSYNSTWFLALAIAGSLTLAFYNAGQAIEYFTAAGTSQALNSELVASSLRSIQESPDATQDLNQSQYDYFDLGYLNLLMMAIFSYNAAVGYKRIMTLNRK